MASLIFLTWLALLLAFSKFWKEHVDVLGIRFSRWSEEFALGKKNIEIRFYPSFVIPKPLWSREGNNVDSGKIMGPDVEKLH
jgi:hypothetical protein